VTRLVRLAFFLLFTILICFPVIFFSNYMLV